MSYKNYLGTGKNLSRHAKKSLRDRIQNEAGNYAVDDISDEEEAIDETSDEEVNDDFGLIGYESDVSNEEVNQNYNLTSDEYESDMSDEEVSDNYCTSSDESDGSFFGDNDDCGNTTSGNTTSNRVVLMILAFFLRHNLTWVALEHLLQLINEISPGAAPTSKYLFSKLLPATRKPTYHYYCRNCSIYLGLKQEMILKHNGTDIKCENCDLEFSLRKKHQCSFFIQLSLKEQIENVVQRYKKHFPSPEDDKTVCEITDITCGNIYKKLKTGNFRK